MKKSKFLKPFSFASLALLMGIAGTMAFAPLGASPSVASANEIETTTTETGGLIVPKKDDPIIYTTENGLQIKYGNAAPSTLNSSLTSGNLAGFPYFTTKNGSTTYTWVIIGRNSNVTTLNTAVQSYLFSTWKSNNSSSNDWKYSNSFFKNTYETSTPAGSAINNVVPSKSYVNDNISFSINDITTNDDEIPSGCVLILSNSTVGSSVWCSSTTGTNGYATSIEHTFSGSLNNLRQLCVSYYTNDTFGFGTYLNLVQQQTLKQYGHYNTNSTCVLTSTDLHFFPLDGIGIDGDYYWNDGLYSNAHTYTNYMNNCNFKKETYLTKQQYALTNYVYCRSMYNHCQAYKVFSDGHISCIANRDCKIAEYVRPACVIKI